MKLFQKVIFRLRNSFRLFCFLKKSFFRLAGMHVGRNTFLSATTKVSWPHKVSIGNNCGIEHDVYFKYDGIWTPGFAINIGNKVFIGATTEFNISESIIIGDYCLIASGCRFVDHNHGVSKTSMMYEQSGKKAAIEVAQNVWIGANAVILMGVKIGEGAVIAAGAVVNKSVPANEIWGGVPARKIGER